MNTCESTSNQPPTSTGQTHRKKYTTSKAYQSHGGRFLTGKIFILTDSIINTDQLSTCLEWNALKLRKEQQNRQQHGFILLTVYVKVGPSSNIRSRVSWTGSLFGCTKLLFKSKPCLLNQLSAVLAGTQ